MFEVALSVVPLVGAAEIRELFGVPPDPAVVGLVVARLRGAIATTAQGLPDAGVTGWQGTAAAAAQRESLDLGVALQGWAAEASDLLRRLDQLGSQLAEELRRRSRLHESLLSGLGRLAALPAELHRDGDRLLTGLLASA